MKLEMVGDQGDNADVEEAVVPAPLKEVEAPAWRIWQWCCRGRRLRRWNCCWSAKATAPAVEDLKLRRQCS